MQERLGIGVDLGATRVRVCVGDDTGHLLWRKSTDMLTPHKVEAYVQQLVERVREGLNQVPSGGQIKGIGIASIGPLDLRKGGMASPANLPYSFVSLVTPLEEAFDIKVVLMNDANAAALGEGTFGAGKGVENLVYVTISTGIGGGAIVDGHLLSGKDGNAAEIGHVVVDPQGRLTCGCGRKGHWEAYCSGRNLPDFARVLAKEDSDRGEGIRLEERLKIGRGEADSASILRRAGEGNRFAVRVAREMGKFNALGVANAVNMFDPSLVTIGGALALHNPSIVLEPIRRLVPKHAINRTPRILLTPLGDDAGLLGALSLVFKG